MEASEGVSQNTRAGTFQATGSCSRPSEELKRWKEVLYAKSSNCSEIEATEYSPRLG